MTSSRFPRTTIEGYLLFILLLLQATPPAWSADRHQIFLELHASEVGEAQSGLNLDVVKSIVAYNRPLHDRNPEWIEEKLRRLAEGPWEFYRGTAHLFYEILRDRDSVQVRSYDPGPGHEIIIHGDLHLGNLGTCEDGRGKIRFDLQDFDEATRGPWVADLLRAATSIAVSAIGSPGDSKRSRREVESLVQSYVESLKKLRAGEISPDYSLKESEAPAPLDDLLHRIKGLHRKDHLRDRSQVKDGHREFRRTDRFSDVPPERCEALRRALRGYVHRMSLSGAFSADYFRASDIVRKKSNGMGSLGVENFLVLVAGPSDDPDDDVILELKEQLVPSRDRVYRRRPFDENGGRRAALAQTALQSFPDRFLGWVQEETHDYLVKEDSGFEESLDPTSIRKPNQRLSVFEVVGLLMAKGHFRQDRFEGELGLESGISDRILAAIGDQSVFLTNITEEALGLAALIGDAFQDYRDSPLAEGRWPE